MFQSHQIAKALMRIVIILLLVQFVTPAFARVNGQADIAPHEKTSYKASHDESGITISVLLKENSEEENKTHEYAPLLTAELIDFTFLTTVLTEHHSRFYWDFHILCTTHQPLFKLHRVFLI